MNKIDTRLDYNLFRVLDAIDQAGGVTAAAELLHITQPAVSHALARLRQTFDDPLFVRQGQGLVASSFARSILPSVREHLNGLNAAVLQAQAFDPAKLTLHFRLGFRDVMESILFPDLIPHLQRTAPKLTLSSLRIQPETITQQLSRGQLDLAFDLSTPVSSEIHSQPLIMDRVCVISRRDHALVTTPPTAISIEQFNAAKHVQVSLKPDSPEFMDAILADLGLRREVVLKCQHYFAACQLVANSDLLLLMPASYATELSKVLPIELHELPVAGPPLELRIYWHESMHNDPGNRWVREQAISLAKIFHRRFNATAPANTAGK